VRHWQRTEVGEAEEGFGRRPKGSSAMRTRRTRSSARTCAASRGSAPARAGLEDVALWHERDISHSSVERVALPDATILADFDRARDLAVRAS
jgi:adenylosuccinate lyase